MHVVILGAGYCGEAIAREAEAAGWRVTRVRRTAEPGVLAFGDASVAEALAGASHVMASVPPGDGGDPVLAAYGHAILRAPWAGYLSSTGVYGDAVGAWVDESAPTGRGRRSARTAADAEWVALGAAVFRLPGIYGPGRSALDGVRAGTARRVDRPGHVFSRIHRDDVAGAAMLAMRAGWRGVVNVSDDLPAEPRAVTEWACLLLGAPPPPLLPLEDAGMGPMARAFWSERRRVANRRLTTSLGYRLRHPTYRQGLTACLGDAR